ncbi:hypothetical protein MKW94_006621 [Papaver nudicaule]|uniref:Carbohydrate kinase PfkB domain-containing protein n=1 Tax=Papaver nudicaule TaxID=74823 RepID=A0AA41S5T3_PAPNU|nr:hypothetical protein [Papaver nudicaule]
MDALEDAKEDGTSLSYDPNVRLPLWCSIEDCREEFLTQWDATDENNVLSLWHDGLKLLMVTDGIRGIFKGAVKEFAVNTVDTAGLEDVFVGSFLCSAAKDSSIFEDETKMKETLTMASAYGAICTINKGDIPSLPDNDDVLKLISDSH